MVLNLARALPTTEEVNVIHPEDQKYCCVGTQTCRATRGIHSIHYALHNCDIPFQQRILKYFRGVEHLFDMYADTSQTNVQHHGNT